MRKSAGLAATVAGGVGLVLSLAVGIPAASADPLTPGAPAATAGPGKPAVPDVKPPLAPTAAGTLAITSTSAVGGRSSGWC